MKKKIYKYIKVMMVCLLITSLTLPSYAAVSASDGSAFVTKAEFDAALSDFNARLTTFEAGINSKIDSQVSSYLDRNGIWNGKSQVVKAAAWSNMKGIKTYKIMNLCVTTSEETVPTGLNRTDDCPALTSDQWSLMKVGFGKAAFRFGSATGSWRGGRGARTGTVCQFTKSGMAVTNLFASKKGDEVAGTYNSTACLIDVEPTTTFNLYAMAGISLGSTDFDGSVNLGEVVFTKDFGEWVQILNSGSGSTWSKGCILMRGNFGSPWFVPATFFVKKGQYMCIFYAAKNNYSVAKQQTDSADIYLGMTDLSVY